MRDPDWPGAWARLHATFTAGATPNHPGPGAHLCNCGHVVAADARRRGVAARMCEHWQWAVERAIRLWERPGFQVVGRLPGDSRHARPGFVEALVMFNALLRSCGGAPGTVYHPPP